MPVMLQSNGMERSYVLHVPAILDLNTPAPLVLNYHGLTFNAGSCCSSMGHCWPGMSFCPVGNGNTEIDANTQIWDFFSRFTLPR